MQQFGGMTLTASCLLVDLLHLNYNNIQGRRCSFWDYRELGLNSCPAKCPWEVHSIKISRVCSLLCLIWRTLPGWLVFKHYVSKHTWYQRKWKLLDTQCWEGCRAIHARFCIHCVSPLHSHGQTPQPVTPSLCRDGWTNTGAMCVHSVREYTSLKWKRCQELHCSLYEKRWTLE